MSNPKVIDTINQEFLKTNPKGDINLTPTQRTEFFRQELMKNAASEQPLSHFLATHNNKVATLEGLIVGQISSQQDNIMKRIEERKNKFNRPKSVPPSSKIQENDGGTTPGFSKKNKDDSPKFRKKSRDFSPKRNNSISLKKEENKTDANKIKGNESAKNEEKEVVNKVLNKINHESEEKKEDMIKKEKESPPSLKQSEKNKKKSLKITENQFKVLELIKPISTPTTTTPKNNQISTTPKNNNSMTPKNNGNSTPKMNGNITPKNNEKVPNNIKGKNEKPKDKIEDSKEKSIDNLMKLAIKPIKPQEKEKETKKETNAASFRVIKKPQK